MSYIILEFALEYKMNKNIKNNMLKFLVNYYSILKTGKFINWVILLPTILDPCLLIPFCLINFSIRYSILIFSILLFQDLLMI
jgi:hypothetical protein